MHAYTITQADIRRATGLSMPTVRTYLDGLPRAREGRHVWFRLSDVIVGLRRNGVGDLTAVAEASQDVGAVDLGEGARQRGVDAFAALNPDEKQRAARAKQAFRQALITAVWADSAFVDDDGLAWSIYTHPTFLKALVLGRDPLPADPRERQIFTLQTLAVNPSYNSKQRNTKNANL